MHCTETGDQAMHNGAAAAAAWNTVTALRFFEASTEFAATVQRHEELSASPDGGLIGEFLRGEAVNALTAAQLLIGRVSTGEDVPDEDPFAC